LSAVDKLTLTEKEFCERVGISRTTAWRMREAGKLPHRRIGRRVLFTVEDVRTFLDRFLRNGDFAVAD
jgi:excisionase family DNA binding protein